MLALGPYREGYSLRPNSRAAIERAPKNPIGVRDVVCTLEEARDMLAYFRSLADGLTMVGDVKAPACFRAFEKIRHALPTTGPLPKTRKKQCPRDGCNSTDVRPAAPGVSAGFGGALPLALEEIWECAACQRPFLLTPSN